MLGNKICYYFLCNTIQVKVNSYVGKGSFCAEKKEEEDLLGVNGFKTKYLIH